jgi:hypothetical protein
VFCRVSNERTVLGSRRRRLLAAALSIAVPTLVLPAAPAYGQVHWTRATRFTAQGVTGKVPPKLRPATQGHAKTESPAPEPSTEPSPASPPEEPTQASSSPPPSSETPESPAGS